MTIKFDTPVNTSASASASTSTHAHAHMKTADILGVLDPLRGAHPTFQKVVTTFFDVETLETDQRYTNRARIRRRTGYPSGLGASHVQVSYQADPRIVHVVYHSTSIVRFMPDRVELDTGGWGTRTTANQMEQWLNFADLHCRISYRFHRGATQEGTLFILFADRTYVVRDGMQFDYEGQPLTDDQPFTGRLEHQGRTHGLDTLDGLQFCTRTADALQTTDEDWQKQIEQLQAEYEQAVAGFSTPPTYEGVKAVAMPPPDVASQEEYPGMTPLEIREEHARRVRAHELWVLQRVHIERQQTKLGDALWTVLQAYTRAHGWEDYDNESDYDHEHRVWGKKFADGLHWTAIEGEENRDAPVDADSGDRPLVYDTDSSIMPWDEFFTDRSTMAQMADDGHLKDYDDVDPELYFSYVLHARGRPEFEQYRYTAAEVYRWVLRDMAIDDQRDRPFVAGEFYAPAHWPVPRAKPDPDQYSMFTYDQPSKPVAPTRPRTERALRPQVYTALTFEAVVESLTSTADMATSPALRDTRRFMTVTDWITEGMPVEKAAVYRAFVAVAEKTIYFVIYRPERKEVVRLNDGRLQVTFNTVSQFFSSLHELLAFYSGVGTIAAPMTFSTPPTTGIRYLGTPEELVRASQNLEGEASANGGERVRTADILDQMRMRDYGQATGDVVTFFSDGRDFGGLRSDSDLGAINQYAIEEGHVGYIDGEWLAGGRVHVYYKYVPDAFELRTRGANDARWVVLPVADLRNPVGAQRTLTLTFDKVGDILDLIERDYEVGQRVMLNVERAARAWPQPWHTYFYAGLVGTVNKVHKPGRMYNKILRGFKDRTEHPWGELHDEGVFYVVDFHGGVGVWMGYSQTLAPSEILPWDPAGAQIELRKATEIYEQTHSPFRPPTPTPTRMRPPAEASLKLLAYTLSDSAWVSPTGEIVGVEHSHEETANETASAVYGPEFDRSSFSGYLFLMLKSWVRVSFGNVSFTTLTGATREWLRQYVDDRAMYGRGDVRIDRWHLDHERYTVSNYQMLYEGPPVDAWDALTSVVSHAIPEATTSRTTADWETYLSGLQFDPQTFLQYARRGQVWSFSRPGQGPRQGQAVHRFVHISHVDPQRGQVDGRFGYSMEQVMTSARPESSARPVDDQWTAIQYIAAYHPQMNEDSTDAGGTPQEVGR